MSNFVDHFQVDGFSAFAIADPGRTIQYKGKDDCHKIYLLSGIGEIYCDQQVYKINGSVLLISKPGTICNWLFLETDCPSYICSFNEQFVEASSLGWIGQCDQLYSFNPIFNLTSDQEIFVRSVFCRMMEEQKTTYPFKTELLQNQICILIHTAHRMVPADRIGSSATAHFSSAVFLELIELGFPEQAQILHFN